MKIQLLKRSLILFAVVLISCQNSTEGNNGEYASQRSSVASISVSAKTNKSIFFIAKATWHNGCGRFSHFTSTKSESTFTISVYGKQPKDAICTQAFIEFDAPVEIAISAAGTYTFKFWKTDSSSIDTTITF